MTSEDVTTIGEIAEVFDGPHATPKKIEEGPYFLSISSLENGVLDLEKSARLSEEDFIQWTRRVTPRKNDLLFSYETRLGEAALMPDGIRACLGRRMGLLRPKTEKVLPEYLLYAYLSPQFQNEISSRKIHGCTVDRIALKELPKFPIRIPELGEQRQVVEVLKSISEKIELNRRTNQTLEQIAQTLFKSWFVDFDPVRAKVAVRAHFEQRAAEHGEPLPAPAALEEAQNIAAAATIAGLSFDPADIDGTRALLEAKLAEMEAEQREQLRSLASEFPASIDDDENGEIPTGWSFRPFGDLLQVQIGGDWGKEEADEKHTESVRIIRGTDIPKLLAGEIESVPHRVVEKKKLAKRALKDGDIVIEVSGGSKGQSTGRSTFITSDLLGRFGVPVEPASFCRLFRPKSKELGAYLSVHLAVIYDAGKMWSYQNQSTGISNFQTKYFLEAETVVMPTEGILAAYSHITENMYARKFSPENTYLAELRDALLPKLLSGEIQLNPEPAAEAS